MNERAEARANATPTGEMAIRPENAITRAAPPSAQTSAVPINGPGVPRPSRIDANATNTGYVKNRSVTAAASPWRRAAKNSDASTA